MRRRCPTVSGLTITADWARLNQATLTHPKVIMRVFDSSLKLYRKTVKRFRPAHIAMHRLMDHLAIPLLERANNFRTIPEDPFWFRLELLTKRHEIETARQLRRLVQPGMVLLDVGAHVGYYTRLFAALTGADGQVIAFEPHPRTHKALQANLRRLPNVTALQVAVAETAGVAELYDYLMMSASGSLHYDESMAALQQAQMNESDVAPRRQDGFEMRKYRVETVTIDQCLLEMGIEQADLVKMDIEGAEINALRGMKRTIAHSPKLSLIMEYNPQALQAFGYEPIQALREVLALGFGRMQAIEPDGSLRDWTDDAGEVRRRTDALLASMGVMNLLFRR